MKKFTHFTLLSTALLLASCNEKISPELQNASSSSTVPTVVVPSEYFFSVTDDSPVLLNYKLHRTGAGNAEVACETRKNVPLSNPIFYKDGADRLSDSPSDITCFFEAEELSLHHGGMSLKVSASPNTCEYIGYSPYGYYNRQPGDSSTNLVQITCSGDTVSDADAATVLGATIETSGATFANCSEFVDSTIAAGDRLGFTITDDVDLCRYNYQDGDEEQCDIGIINVSQYTVVEDTVTGLKATRVDRKIKCGGKVANCVAGPIKLVDQKNTIRTTITQTELNVAFEQVQDFPAPVDTEFPGNFGLANYRRNLASSDIEYGTSFGTDATLYMPFFGGIDTFNPDVMDRYSNNKLFDNSGNLITPADHTTWSFVTDNALVPKKYFATRPLAAEPIIGMDGYRVNPFYTFYCLDRAMDIKSRIRILVRDWDRVFPTTDKFELISDINLLTNSRQDVFSQEEIPDDQDSLNPYNDIRDWDDFFFMDVALSPSPLLVWRPTPLTGTDIKGGTANYTDGFFNPSIFPQVETID